MTKSDAIFPQRRIVFHYVDLHNLPEEREATLRRVAEGQESRAAMTQASELELTSKLDCNIVHTNIESTGVFIAPLRYGAGIEGKAIQSLCYGTPSVITSMAAEGIGLISGQETIIADGAEEFAQEVLRLCTDPVLWCCVQAAGYKFVKENFSWKRCPQVCEKAFAFAKSILLERHERTLRSELDELVFNGKPIKALTAIPAH